MTNIFDIINNTSSTKIYLLDDNNNVLDIFYCDNKNYNNCYYRRNNGEIPLFCAELNIYSKKYTTDHCVNYIEYVKYKAKCCLCDPTHSVCECDTYGTPCICMFEIYQNWSDIDI
jgi:hypothetical protein